ncbi:FAD-dependent monooxygenase [Actinomadura rupiterrae]|uniref:FAD-dependent monooxygenase n=1 Tax=Actinomadura rupiterrae TaxID=559627 RepID=UPI0020A26D7F|nr:FAD-dependent monooxygenase [Actinomadura rupiterrae]MCP2341360.1 2-polyprenyl-6-methoxyphenol hydroxylase-like FAD-dependent oxidoreductase [Actinomadura rupiterrae]
MSGPEVIVAGVGPTGLLLATELELAGVDVEVLERRPARTGQSKALNLQPRSAEILDLRGLLEPVLDQALALLPGGHFAGLPVPLDYTALQTRHPYQIGIPQARVEELLEDRLARPVARGSSLAAFTQDADGVTVTTSDGRELRARYLVGCDGGRSTVRKLLGTPFTGRDPRVQAVVADVILNDHEGLIPAEWTLPALNPSGSVFVLPLTGGAYRVVFAGAEQQGLPRDAPITEDEVRRALAVRYQDALELVGISWASRFNDTSRQAEQYRSGRVFLAGDAAHVHFPLGGQGLNLGLQDAFNLGWKLAAAVRGTAPDGLLDTYHDERHPIAARVLANTRAQGVLTWPDGDVAAFRALFADLLALPDTNRYLAEMVSGLDTHYPMPGDHPLLGRRMPDLDLATPAGPTRVSHLMRDGRALLLTFGSSVPPENPRVQNVRAEPSPQLDADAVLIRPDGHVCWVGSEPGAAVSAWFGPPAEAAGVSGRGSP